MSYDLVVRGGTIVTAADSYVGDIGIRGGRIAAIGDGLPRGAQEVDARGLQVLPGGIDVHTHLDIDLGGHAQRRRLRVRHGGGRLPEASRRSATTPGSKRAGRSRQTVEEWKARAAGRAHVDYGFHVVVNDASARPRSPRSRAIVAAGYPSSRCS